MCLMCAATQVKQPDCSAGPDTTYSDGAIFASRVEVGDAAANVGTSAFMSVGDTFSGNLSAAGDRDWIAVTLVAGQSYTVSLNGGTLNDAYLNIYDSSGTLRAYDDDSGPGLNSLANFTATTSGTYYLSAQSFLDRYSGSYVLEIQTSAPPEPLSTYTMSEIAYQLTNTFWGGQSQAFNVTANSGTISFNVQGLAASSRGLARDAIQIWAETTGLNFVETSGTADITFDDNNSGAYSTSELGFSATANADSAITSSFVNVSTAWISNYGTNYDGYSYQTYIHEIGHALGLGHAGAYNGSASYPTNADYSNDSWQATVMSYFSQRDNTTINADYAYVVSPMIADILALQDIYGVANDLRTGNTSYGYNCNAGGMYQTLFEGITTGGFSDAVTMTIVDHGGYDTIDLRGQTVAQRLDMRAGAVSDVFGAIGNLSIMQGTVIESAIGGLGNDVIIGNAANNRIIGLDGQDSILGDDGADFINGANGFDTVRGGVGNDTIWGGSGNDWLFGEYGWDTLQGDNGRDYLIDNFGNDRLLGGAGDDYMTGGVGRDTLDGGADNDEMLGGADNDVLYGRDGNDTMRGGAGADQLWGEAGNDLLEGGAGQDALRGGAGVDTFVFSAVTDSTTAAADQIFDFARGVDRIDVSALGATWIGTAAFSGAADELRLHRVGGVSRLELDHDGNGIADMTIHLVNNSNLTITDLIL